MKEKSVISKKPEPDDKVKLEPILGIRPGVYLTVLYSIILILIFYFFLLHTGIINPGAVLQVKTEPQGAAVRVDGVYMGTEADKIFVSKGNHTIEAVLPGFETVRVTQEIPGRVFGSLFFPKKFPLEFNLKSGDPVKAFAEAAADFAEWTFAGEPTSVWQIPLSLSEGAYRLGVESDAQMTEILNAAARFTVTRAALRDLVRAKIIIDNKGLSPSPASLFNSITDILAFLSENPGSAAWLAGLLPSETAAIVKNSQWYKNEITAVYQPPPSADNSKNIKLEGLNFIAINSGAVYQAEPFPYITQVDSFYISEEPVSKTLYENFLNDHPQWKDEVENEIFPAEFYEKAEITGITWNAAQAFCQWMTKRLPQTMADMEVKLPSEAQWESAANLFNLKAGSWDWCDDLFVPLPFIKASQNSIQMTGSKQRALRGFISATGQSQTAARTSFPPDLTSPLITFRPVISLKGK